MFKILSVAFVMYQTVTLCAQSPVQEVDPFIGTGGVGHTYPGATVPFGMVQPSPDTRNFDYKACAGYHYDDTTILGFSQTHLSGTGIGDMGDILLQPVSHDPSQQIVSDPTGYPYRSRFSHQNESAQPGYYQVFLDDHQVNVELTASQRVAFHRYSYKNADTAALVIDLWHNLINWTANTTQWANIQVLNDSTVTGYRLTHAWAHERYIYFAMRFSKPMQRWGIINMLRKGLLPGETYARGMKPIKMIAHFDANEADPLMVKVAISGTSIAGALLNLTEIPHWNFDQVQKQAHRQWEKELSRVQIKADPDTRKIFYTALYHTFLAPVIYNDLDGSYRGIDHNIYQSDRTNYTVFSLWDTFRALHPLFTLIQQHRTQDMVHAMMNHYRQYTKKKLPIWSFHANETDCMIGYHSVPVIVDAYLKGIVQKGKKEALDAMVLTANNPLYDGLDLYKEYGYIPIDLEKEAASKTLEYAFDDWSIAQMAEMMEQDSIYQLFMKRAGYYKNIFDPETGFMRARKADGNFREPFDPSKDSFAGGDFTEANSWRYSWFVPHDINGLIALHGSKRAFEKKLDDFFNEREANYKHLYFGKPAIIGEYEHGNEPVHHVAYLFNYCEAPEKTQRMVYRVMNDLYKATPDGLIGNDDCGQMSAWYIFSSLGFYPTNPVGGRYDFGIPSIDAANIALENGNTVNIEVQNRKNHTQQIRKITWNGQRIENYAITHQELMKGGTLTYVLK